MRPRARTWMPCLAAHARMSALRHSPTAATRWCLPAEAADALRAWWLAPFGLAVAGAPMLGVPVTGTEPPLWLFLLSVIPTFVGMIAAGVLGTRRVWPWWVGLGLALFLPVMFVVPLNGLLLASSWRPSGRASR
jgi:hypothetical protein